MSYYLGAYHLLKLQPLEFGESKGKKVWTGSRCINDSYFDAWALSWTNKDSNGINEAVELFGLTDNQLEKLHKWADDKFELNKLGWIDVFLDVATLLEYKTTFFNNQTDLTAIGVYFHASVIDSFLTEYKPRGKDKAVGIHSLLSKKIPENDSLNEKFIGYELLGMEEQGDYHSLHCNSQSDLEALFNKFDISLNTYGLINDFSNKKELVNYINCMESNMISPAYLVKVKTLNI